ncbi:MAG: hypothetical protein HY043_16675 [Verrucomicrobia bacterium]|nr:hypothetical protein [Verrucomicrobiota bacterium]
MRNMDSKRLVALAIYFLITFLLLWEAYDFVVVNEGVRYFRDQPIQLLWAAGGGIVGGFAVVGFLRLPEHQRHAAKLTALVCCAIALTIFAVSFIRILWLLHSSELVKPSFWQIVEIAIGLLGLSGFAWLEFIRVFKRKKSLFF